MAERVETVRLTANVANYLAGMEAAGKGTTKVVDTLAKQKAAAAAAAEAQGRAASKIGTAMVGIGVVAAAAVAISVKAFADFDAKMAQVRSLSHAGAADMASLTEEALTAGQKIGFSANEVADAEIELVKAGVSVKDQLGGGLVGTLNLAAAGQLDVADATQIAASAMTQFKLKGSDVPAIADALAAGADKALGSVQDLGEGLKFVGPVANSMGISLNETVGTLSLFAQNGILGSQAGTGLRGVLLSLTSPSKLASDTLAKYNVNLYDAQGHFVGLNGTAEQLKKGLGGLDEATRNQALGQIFGNQQITEAEILMDGGAKAVNKWTAAVDDQGFAAEQASGKMNNLEGDLKKLEAAFQTSLIEAGSGANGELRALTQGVTNAVTAVGNLPQPLITTGVVLLSVVAGVGLLGGGFLVAIPKIAAMKVALADLNISARSAAIGLGKGGGLLLVLTSIASGLANTGSSAELSAEQLEKVNAASKNINRAGLDKLFKNASNSLLDSTASADKFKEALNDSFTGNFFTNESSAYKFIDGMSLGLTHLSDLYKTNEAQFKQLGATLATTADTDFGKASDEFSIMVKAAGGTDDAYQQLFNAMPDYKAKLIALASAQGVTLTQQQLQNLAVGKGALAQTIATQTAQGLVTKTQDLGVAASDASGQVSDLASQIEDFGKANLDTRDAQRNFQAAVDGVSAAIKQQEDAYKTAHKTLTGFNASLDIGTDAGRQNQAALDNIAKTAFAASAAILKQTGSQDDATKAINDGRTALIHQLAQFGITGKKAETYADQLGLIPNKVDTQITVDGISTANAALQHFITTWDGRRITVDLDGRLHLPNGQIARASGGILPGAPSSRDNMMIHAASGEFVTNAKSTANPSNRAALEYINSGGVIKGYAGGGYVQPQYASSSAGGGYVDQRKLSISVSLPGSVIGDDNHIAKVVTAAVKTAVNNGTVSRDWANR